MDSIPPVVPKWYSQSLIHVEDDTILIKWVFNETTKVHTGYCKFCDTILWDSDVGSPYNEYSHMITEHPEQVAIFRLGRMGDT